MYSEWVYKSCHGTVKLRNIALFQLKFDLGDTETKKTTEYETRQKEVKYSIKHFLATPKAIKKMVQLPDIAKYWRCNF